MDREYEDLKASLSPMELLAEIAERDADMDDEDFDDCTNCHQYRYTYGYCGENGVPFCQECWDAHVRGCERCTNECEE